MGDHDLGPESSFEQKPNMKVEKEEMPNWGLCTYPPHFQPLSPKTPTHQQMGKEARLRKVSLLPQGHTASV